MWIVLLDHSASMGEPFEASGIMDLGRIRTVEAQVKLDAAKKSFLLELERLPASMPVTLFGFTSSVTEIHSGLASDVGEFDRHVSQLRPVNGTNIAVALDHVVDSRYESPQVLLISDGKSHLEHAKSVAHRCAEAGIRVDVLMIDPTDEGLEMAKAIAGITHGRWDPVTSADELARRTRERGDKSALNLARAEELLRQADDEYHSLETSIREQPGISFSAGYPVRIDPYLKYTLVVYIHLDDLKELVEKYLRTEIAATGAAPTCSNAAAATRIPRGTLLTVQPNISGIFANPPRQEIVWLEDYHKLAFEIRHAGPDAAEKSCAGFIDILANGAFIGHIPVSIAVDSDSAPPSEAISSTVTSNPFARIFASYSHEDDVVVQACKETYKAFGIHLYVDRDDLLSGQSWRQTLQKLIAKCDLFQLYWSQPAANSTEVAREWELALVVDEARPGDFIRPLYWRKPMPDPPVKLGHLHFAYLDVDKLRIAPRQMQVEKDDSEWSTGRISDAVFPIISLVDDESRQSIATIQKTINQAVGFLEHVTGLRYYPPTTLLVDDYIVSAVRSFLTVDPAPDRLPEDDGVGYALEILQSIALAFHVHDVEPKGLRDDDEQKRFFRLNTELEWNDFRHVRNLCEYIFSHPVKCYLEGNDPFAQPSRNSADEFKRKAKDSFWLQQEFGHILAVATHEDKRQIENVLGSEPLQSLLDWSTDPSNKQIVELAERGVSATYLSIAEKYRNGFFDLFRDYETTLCRNASFGEYLGAWFDHWMKYLRIVQSEFKARVEIGYTVSQQALDWLMRRYPNVQFDVLSESKNIFDRKDSPDYTWAITVDNIVECVTVLRPVVMDAVMLPDASRNKVRKYFVSTATTYGIFAHAKSVKTTQFLLELARKQNWPAGFALEGCHKILLCTNAFERYISTLVELELDQQRAITVAESFLVATLVHEHCHGILAVGTDKQGNGSWAAINWDEWQKGNTLNESIAAWAERHFFRNNEVMFGNITEYINEGEYPEWPYRGAERLERIYKESGCPGVRAWIQRLREDPQFAQEMFDELP